MSADIRAGFVGKVPSHGDFISRHIPKDLETEILKWAQAGIEYSKTMLKQSFLEKFLVAPVWRGYVSSEIFGNPYVFILIPSVDKVGRYFPFLLLCRVSEQLDPFESSCEKWFNLAEELALSVLDEQFRIDPFVEDIRSLGHPLPEGSLGGLVESQNSSSSTVHKKGSLEVQSDSGLNAMQASLNQILIRRMYEGHCQLWTQGGDYKKPSILIDQELPRGAQFVKLIAEFE